MDFFSGLFEGIQAGRQYNMQRQEQARRDALTQQQIKDDQLKYDITKSAFDARQRYGKDAGGMLQQMQQQDQKAAADTAANQAAQRRHEAMPALAQIKTMQGEIARNDLLQGIALKDGAFDVAQTLGQRSASLREHLGTLFGEQRREQTAVTERLGGDVSIFLDQPAAEKARSYSKLRDRIQTILPDVKLPATYTPEADNAIRSAFAATRAMHNADEDKQRQADLAEKKKADADRTAVAWARLQQGQSRLSIMLNHSQNRELSATVNRVLPLPGTPAQYKAAEQSLSALTLDDGSTFGDLDMTAPQRAAALRMIVQTARADAVQAAKGDPAALDATDANSALQNAFDELRAAGAIDVRDGRLYGMKVFVRSPGGGTGSHTLGGDSVSGILRQAGVKPPAAKAAPTGKGFNAAAWLQQNGGQ